MGTLERLTAGPDAIGRDVVAVWICAVPLDTTDPTYDPSTFRLRVAPDDVVHRAGARLDRYFDAISHGMYGLSLVAGGTIEMRTDDDSHDCVDRAIDAQTRTGEPADVLLAVGTAEHTISASGGWGTIGDALRCGDTCTLATSRRAAYVGASDFHPDHGDAPLLDLVEHELAHTLGLPHSGAVGQGEAGYASALDLMSNSAAPRDVDPTRLDGPDIIGVDRLALGWLSLDDVTVVTGGGDTSIALAPSTAPTGQVGPTGQRLAVVPLDDHRMLTVELLEPSGFDAHLPHAGIAVHLIDDHDVAELGPTARIQETLGGPPPFTDLLTVGDSLEVMGWRIEVTALAPGAAQLAVAPTDR